MIPPGRHASMHQPCRYYEPSFAIVSGGGSGPLLCTRNSGHVTGAAKHLAGQRAGHLAMVDDRHTVYEYELHSLRQLIGILESGDVVNFRGIEDDDVCAHSRFQDTAVHEAHA